MMIEKKYLDYEGVKHLWSKVNMQDYPNNDMLMSVIEAIDETKVDKSELIGTNQLTWDGITLGNIQVGWFMHLVSYDIPIGFLYANLGKFAWNNRYEPTQELFFFKGNGYSGLSFVENPDSVSSICALAVTKGNIEILGDTFTVPGFYLNADAEYNEFVSPLYYEWNLLDQKANREDVVQSDWNESDEASPAFVKNKTHYEDKISIVWDGNFKENDPYPLSLVETDEEKINFILEANAYEGSTSNGDWLYEINRFDFDNYIIFGSGEECPDSIWHVKGILALEDNLEIPISDIPFPVKGLYLINDDYYWEYCSPFIAKKIQKIDAKFIPWPDKDEALSLAIELGLVNPAGEDYDIAFVDESNRIFIL